jgi:hypothetical protein
MQTPNEKNGKNNEEIKGETTMNESLSQMVKDAPVDEGVVFSEADLDLPLDIEEKEAAPTEETTPVAEETPSDGIIIGISTMTNWFETHGEFLDNINQVKVAIRGIDANNTLIMAVKDGNGEVDEQGNDKRTLRVFDNADSIIVLDLPPVAMDVYNNGFKIVYQQGDIFIKTYGVRTGLICTLCTEVGGKLIPYSVLRVKKKDEELIIPDDAPALVTETLAANADLEKLQLLYKQSSKSIEDLSTNQSVIDWLLERQDSVTDINHHLQIDNVLINMIR